MRTPIVVAAVAVLAIAAGGAWYGLEVYPQRQFRAGLDQTLATLPPGVTMTYKDAHYAPVSGVATLSGVALHGIIPTDPPQPFDVTVDTIETTNANLDLANAWSNAVANRAAFGPDASLAVADAVSFKGVSFRSAMFSGTEDSLRLTKPRVFPWALLHDGMPSWKDIQTAMGTRSVSPSLAEIKPVLRAEAAIITGMAYDSYEVVGAKSTQSVPGTEVKWSIRKMSGSGFDRGVLGAASAETIAASGGKLGSFSAERLTIGASDFREPMIRIVNGEPLTQSLLTGIKIGKIEYIGLAAEPPGKPAVRIGGVSVGPIVFNNGFPVAVEFAGKDIGVTREQIPAKEAQEIFDELGLKTLTASFEIAYSWDLTQQRVSAHDTVTVKELGTLTQSIDLASVAPNLTTLIQSRLAHAKTRFQDASLVDRLLRMGAARSGADPAVFRQQIAGMVLAQSAAFGGDSPAILAAGKAVGEFIGAPRSLTVELAPPAPVPFRTLANKVDEPSALASMLGLAVAANQP